MIGKLEFVRPELRERLTFLNQGPNRSGEFGFYWMRTAMRGHENPALELLLNLSEHLNVPVFVYQGLSERYPYASDRHHRFVLEGARDVADELATLNVPYLFHLERPGHREPILKQLVSQARFVITESMPVEFLRDWSRKLANEAAGVFIEVDTSCVVPMPLVGKAHDRAFKFRDATKAERARRLEGVRCGLGDYEAPAQLAEQLAFDPAICLGKDAKGIDLATADLSELIASCDIDHSVGPVAHTRGGSRAGYRRWEHFLRTGLKSYHRRRNDAAIDGVSRMSAYLHYGQVSPFQIAREAHELGGGGAEKYLDELLIWREFAYSWCHFSKETETLAALPKWALAELEAHRSDERLVLTEDQLVRGGSDSEIWNAAQTSLLRHGELHNNVRMTWGKAIPEWTDSPESACRWLFELNNRFALDGRDPNSTAGLLWCLGLFDRPFQGRSPALGRIRGRSLKNHQARLDMKQYLKKVSAPSTSTPSRIAIIGAGVAGLFCARTLQDHGHEVVVFDKGRRPGGRLSTRRHRISESETHKFDHGVQYFTASNRHFAKVCESLVADGVLARWQPRPETMKTLNARESGLSGVEQANQKRYVGIPDMDSLAFHLAADLDLRTETRIGKIERAEKWTLTDTNGSEFDGFDQVVLAVPAPQAIPLLATVSRTQFQPQLEKISWTSTWALLAVFKDAFEPKLEAGYVPGSPLYWIARSTARPGRAGRETWIAHATREWSESHLELEKAEVAELLAAELRSIVGANSEFEAITAHRWRFAFAETGIGEPCLFDREAGLGVAGAWCLASNIESAYLSGVGLAGRILNSLASRGAQQPEIQQTLF